MKKSKLMITLYIVLGLVALILIGALFTKSDYLIKKEITIQKSDTLVFDFLKNLKNHKSFNVWFLKDPNLKETFQKIDGQVGFILAYEGNKEVGSGEQELIGLQPYQKIDIELRFLKPMKNTSKTPYQLIPIDDNQTKVVWTMHGKMPYPLNLSLLFINMDSFLGNDMQQSLQNLKVKLEK